MRARMGMRLLRSQVILGAVIVFTHDARIWTGNQVGITETPWWIALVAGAAVYAIFVLLVNWVTRVLGVRNGMVAAAFNALRQIYPRRPHQKCSFATALVLLNPITEEWLYRGVAVVWLANQTHPVFAIAFGMAVSISVHAYQGLNLVPFQLVFHAIACALALSPFGLLGSIGFHFLGDAYPMYRFRKQMPYWVAERRKQIARKRPKESLHNGG